MKKPFNLKNAIGAGVAVLACAGMITVQSGCSKSSSTTATPAKDTLSSVTVATSIQSLVTSTTSGIGPQTESSAQTFQTMGFACGTIMDTTMSGLDTGAGMTIKYSITSADTAFCTGSTLTKVDFFVNDFMDMSMTGAYFGGKNKMFMSMSGLDSAAANYSFTETCTGTDTVKETSPQNLTCYMSLNYSASNIVLSKSTNMITSGTASIQYSYTTSSGNSYNESANVTFLGNMQAVIKLANGYTTTVSW